MGIFSSWDRLRAETRAERQAKARSNEIDLTIEQDSRSFRRQCNVLLISIPESEAAASALIMRMKTLHDGHPNDEPAQLTYKKSAVLRPAIWKILLHNLQRIVMAIRSQKLGPARLSNRENRECITNHRIDADSPESSFLPKFGRAVQDLWAEDIIHMLLDRPSCLSVDEKAAYFFAEAQRFDAEEYLPSIEDFLRAAERRIKETYFEMGQLSIRVSQVYGHGGERRKWIHLFEGVTSIIFYASLSDYDERVVGRGEQTRLVESFALFEAVVNSRWFLRTSVVLFLTDIAAFRTKLHKVPLAQYLPEYTGGTDVNKAAKYILWRFMQLNRARLDTFPHITEASDTNNLRLVFVVLKETILQNALKDSGIL